MLKLIAFTNKRETDIASELIDEKNRKKSPNMLFAIAAGLDIFNQIESLSYLKDSVVDIIFCTGEGEMAQTFEFYKNLANNGRAQPLVFQNSLHNSTLGALSLSVSPLSSGITLSNGSISCEMAIDMALAMASTNPILILGTDVYFDKVNEIRSYRKENQKHKVELVSGACAALFLPASHPAFNSINAPILSDIKIKKMPEEHVEVFENYYPANGLEGICNGLKNKTAFTINRPPYYQIAINEH